MHDPAQLHFRAVRLVEEAVTSGAALLETVRFLGEELEYDWASFWEPDAGFDQLICSSLMSLSSDEIPSQFVMRAKDPQPIGKGAVAGAWIEGAPIVGQLSLGPTRFRSLWLPLRSRQNTLGVIELIGKSLSPTLPPSIISSLTIVSRFLADRIQVQKMEEELQARKDYLISSANQIKSPLTSLLLLIQKAMRLEEAQTPRLFEQILDACEKNCKRVVSLADQLVAYASDQLAHAPLQLESFDLGEAIREWTREMKIPVRIHGHKAVVGEWDRAMLELAFRNLLYSLQSLEPQGTVEVRIAEESGAARIEAERESPLLSGLILRPALARQIAELHGGALTSRNGKEGHLMLVMDLPIESHPSQEKINGA